MDVKIGKVRGNLLGFVRFHDLTVSEPGAGPAQAPVLTLKELEFRFRFWDLLSKNIASQIFIAARSPEIHWKPYLGIRRPHFPFFGWLREWTLAHKNNFVLKVEDLGFYVDGTTPLAISGVAAEIRGEQFHFEVPVTHVAMGRSDVTTVIGIDGRFERGPDSQDDKLSGTLRTEGTVIDWKPVSQEARFNFEFTPEYFLFNSVSFVGGLQWDGHIDFRRDYELNLSIHAQDVPMNELAFFTHLDQTLALAERFDMEVVFKGSLFAPQIEAHVRVYDGTVASREFRVMDLNAEGVYPTVRLNNSRILFDDGSTMRFADEVLEISALASSSTFKSLVSQAQQDRVVWGDWEFSRPRVEEDKSEFLMQRLVGENARLQFRKKDEDEGGFRERESRDMEVGFEYKLASDNVLKLEYRDDQEVVGVVEKKLRF